MWDKEKIIKYLNIIAKIFLIWLLLQFFLQTFVTYRLGLNWVFWSVVWMWKEIIIIWLLWFVIYYFCKKQIFSEFWKWFILKKFVIVFLITLFVAFIISCLINKTGLGIYMVSVKYSMTGFLIFIIFFVIAWLFFWAREINLTKRYIRVIKYLLILGIFWRWIIWLTPRVLEFAWYNQYNYEGTIGISPPTTYYTQFDNGYVRNQFLFERPISRWFFLIAFWPLFFIYAIKKNPRWDGVLRWSLYGLAVLSTFSRAAWLAWIIQTLILIFLQFGRRFRKTALYSFLPFIILLLIVTRFGRSQIISREFSNTWHLRSVLEAVQKIWERPIRWQGAGSAWPASYQINEKWKAYNPENQYLQIWMEYGIFGFVGWIYLYFYLHSIGYRSYINEREHKNKIIKKVRFYWIIIFAFSLWLLWLSIEWLVLHSFVDRMIVYPFMALFGISYGIYLKSLNK